MFKRTLSLLLMLALSLPAMAELATPDQIVVYKETETRDLKLHIFYPEGGAKAKNRPAVISFFGGGWTGGNPNQFFDQSSYYASLGMVGISVEYRIMGRDKTTPFESVKDAKSAVRWVRENAKMLGVDPKKVVASGGSAGGHIALCTAMFEAVDDEPNSDFSSVPNALILFNPVLDTSKETGFGYKKFDGREMELSPVHKIYKNMPPTLILHGSQDSTVPYRNAVEFYTATTAIGNDCKLITGFGENHGFFNSPNFKASAGENNYNRCMREATIFLAKNGFISKKLIAKKPEPVRIACVGNSITYGASIEEREKNCYPAILQNMLGDDYEVRNFGRSGATVLNKGNLPYAKSQEYKDLLEYAPDVVIIKLGTNDSKAANWVNKDEFEADYTTLIKGLRTNKKRRPELYMCTPVPAFTSPQTNYINSRIVAQEVVAKVRKVAKENKVVVVDLHTAFEDKASLLPDKVHPNAEGAKEMAIFIYNEIIGIE